MKNDEVIVHLESKKAGWRQSFYKDAGGWHEISSRGNVFSCTAEQVLNHLLPALSIKSEQLKVIVEKKDE